ncbi:MAG TPA: serine hydrolase [Kineosporiaceae bacterium]|nr:serine hydrolase [Kineosporiaceae bacterium]
MGRRRRGGVVVCGVLLGVLAAAAPAQASVRPAALAAAARPAASPAPVCATAVAYSSGTATTAPVPLPAPASDAGGPRLAQPGLQVQLRPGTPAPPRLKASAWIVADLTTGDVIAACNAHVPMAPASTLKVLTALALHPRLDVKARYVARPEDAAIDGTKVGLSPRSVYTVDDLWHGLLMGSGNDAANALAALAGGTPTAAQLLTRTARSLGARDTVAVNTSGLDAPGQVSSVYDLALFGRAALADPGIAALVRTQTYSFPSSGTAIGGPARRTYQIQNHNRLLANYPGATGIKNGYTSTAGASLVASATRDGHSYVVAMLRSDVDVWHMGKALLDWAFAQKGGAEPVGRLDGTPAPDSSTSTVPTTSPVPVQPGGGGHQSAPRPAAVPQVVTAPVKATFASVPQNARALALAALVALALVGGALVRRVALARAGTPRKPPTPPARRPSSPKRPSPAARSTTAKRPAAKRSTTPPRRPR